MKKHDVQKLKDLPQDVNDYEKILFSKMFMLSDSIDVEICGMSLPIRSTVKKRIRAKYNTAQNRVYTKKSVVFQYLSDFTCGSSVAAVTVVAVYLDSMELLAAIIMGVVFMGLIGWLGALLISDSVSKRKSDKKSARAGKMIGGILIRGTHGSFLPVVFHLSGMVGCAAQQRRAHHVPIVRPDAQADGAGRAVGRGASLDRKRFIETAEADRIKTMVKDDPASFYHILPYAYVLGVTDGWAKRF